MKTVLFLGLANSTRTQMAEAILRHRAGDRFRAYSAGSVPGGLHTMTKRVLREIGIDPTPLVSKSLRAFLGRSTVHYAIILSHPEEKEGPRIYPFALEVLHWSFENPAIVDGDDRQQLNAFRRVRDLIDRRICDWLTTEVTRKADIAALV